jgi:hypothetical protein
MTSEGMGPCLAVEEGATTRAVFEAYVEKVLVHQAFGAGRWW